MNEKANFLTRIKEHKLYKKLKSIKNIEIIIAIVIIALMILIYSVSFSRTKEKTQPQQASVKTAGTLTELETELASVLSNINGVGKVKVLITYEGSTELKTANTTTSNSSVSLDKITGQKVAEVISETRSPIIVTVNGISAPIVLTEVLPPIRGVIIVAEGADKVATKLQLIRAVTVALKINGNQIEVFAMN